MRWRKSAIAVMEPTSSNATRRWSEPRKKPPGDDPAAHSFRGSGPKALSFFAFAGCRFGRHFLSLCGRGNLARLGIGIESFGETGFVTLEH
jgi:hypothetical protein